MLFQLHTSRPSALKGDKSHNWNAFPQVVSVLPAKQIPGNEL